MNGWTRLLSRLAAAIVILGSTSLLGACSDPTPKTASVQPTDSVQPTTPSPVIQTVTLTGRVHESLPTEDIAVGNAEVVVVDSGGNRQSASTDASGRFTTPLARGLAQITVGATGYEMVATSIDLTGDIEVLLPMRPVRREIRLSFPYIYPPPPPSNDVQQRLYRVAVHHEGELRARYTNSWYSASSQASTRLEVRDGNNRVLAESRGQYDNFARSIRLQVAPGIYEVKFSVCCGDFLSGFAGELTHPN